MISSNSYCENYIVNESENIYDRLSSYEEIYLQFITGDKDMRAHIRHSMPLCIRTSDHSTTRESRNDSPMLYMYVHVTHACIGEFSELVMYMGCTEIPHRGIKFILFLFTDILYQDVLSLLEHLLFFSNAFLQNCA